tara:strand:+ start:2606 stop:3223 length:618 start_codon:yes stop_codon:yes gene_type:complete
MAIKLTDKIHTVAAGVDTVNKGSAQANAGREAYTLQDVSDLIGGGSADTNLGNSDLVQTGTGNRSYLLGTAGQSLSFVVPNGATQPMLKLNVNNSVEVNSSLKFRVDTFTPADTRYLTLKASGSLAGATSYSITLPGNIPTVNQQLSNLLNGELGWTDPASKVNLGTAPASATSAGEAGDVVWTADYIYVCTATDTWKRVAIATW